jgi:RNA polymerase sigma-70 factor (ECF subfamily)
MTVENSTIKELYEKYGYVIYGRCRRILGDGDEARDALQAVFLKLIENQEVIRQPERIVSWIFTAASNHCFNILRSRKKFNLAVEPDTLDGSDHFEKRHSARQIINLLLENQDRKTQQAVYYTHVENLDQKEIQKLTGQSPATIRRNLRKFEEYCRKNKARFGIQ